MKTLKKKKQIGVVLMVFALMIGSIGNASPIVRAATNRTQAEAVNWASGQIGKGLDYDGAYGNQCVDLIKYYYDYFGVAGYAMGNANAYITNNLPSGWTRVYSGYQPGDIAVWKTNHSCSTCNTSSYGHVGIITSADSVGFNAVNQNFNSQSHCTQNWFYCSALACAIRPSYTSPTPTPEQSVTFQDFSQNSVSETNAEMYIKIMNPNKQTCSSVGCYVYNNAGTLIQSYSENCGLSSSYINYNCNINNDMHVTLSPGTTYKFVLYANINGTEYKDTMRSFTTNGTAEPATPEPATAEPATPVPATAAPATSEPSTVATATPFPTSTAVSKPQEIIDGILAAVQDAVSNNNQTVSEDSSDTSSTNQVDEDEDVDEEDADEEVTVSKGKIVSVKNQRRRKLKVSVKELDEADYYQVVCGTNRSITKNKKQLNSSKTKITFKNLKKKTYYVKVRGYYKESGKKIYGEWSSVKKIKINK